MSEVHWANVLVWSRAMFIIPITIFFFLGHFTEALVMYIIAALTDCFDGMAARIQKTESELGAQMDGGADFLFMIGTLGWMFIAVPHVYNEFWFEFLLAFISYAIYAVMSWYTYGLFVRPHLWSAKVSTLFFFCLLPVLLIWGIVPWYVHATWIIFTLSRIEAIWYVASKRTEVDIPTVFLPSSSELLKQSKAKKKK